MKLSKPRNLALLALFTALLISCAQVVQASSKTLLPRFPEIIIEKGLSQNFLVSECKARCAINGNESDSSIWITLTNQSSDPIESSIKYRVLYPMGDSQTRIRANGKSISYDRKNPRLAFTLQPEESIKFEIHARSTINYSIDAVRKALREEKEESQSKRKRFVLDDFTKFFSREKFGHRFMVGGIISKWGIFPLKFDKVDIEVIVPANFVLVASNEEEWDLRETGREKTFRFSKDEGFNAAVFLPESDKEDFIKTQEILTSEKFMH